MADGGDEFTPVTHKRAPKKRKGQVRARERTLAEQLDHRRALLDQSRYLTACRELLRDAMAPTPERSGCPAPACVVCLGLGSVADSSKSQDQYLLMQAVLSELQAPPAQFDGPVSLYDPVFSEADKAFFATEGYSVLDSGHSLNCDVATLLYMPHCPRSLYEDVLRANWSPRQLENVIMLGNRLDGYDDPTHPSASSGTKSPLITKSLPLWVTISLPPDKDRGDVFNELAFQWTTKSVVSSQPPDFWAAAGPPSETTPDSLSLAALSI